MRMDKDICKVMFNEVELHGVCKRLGEQITKDYEGKDLLIVGILNGAIVFVTDLMRQIDQIVGSVPHGRHYRDYVVLPVPRVQNYPGRAAQLFNIGEGAAAEFLHC